jgi:hypothetical protein
MSLSVNLDKIAGAQLFEELLDVAVAQADATVRSGRRKIRVRLRTTCAGGHAFLLQQADDHGEQRQNGNGQDRPEQAR